jgi:hypothetical protein
MLVCIHNVYNLASFRVCGLELVIQMNQIQSCYVFKKNKNLTWWFLGIPSLVAIASLFASCWSTNKWNSMSVQHQHYSFCFWILPSLVPFCHLWPLLEFCDPWPLSMTILGLHILLQIPCQQVECIFKFVFVLYHMCKSIGSHSLLHC